MAPIAPPAAGQPPQWRQFAFYDSAERPDDHLSEPFASPTTISATASYSGLEGSLLVAVEHRITLFNRQLEEVLSWDAFADGRCTHLAEARGVVIALGEDATPYPSLRIYSLPTSTLSSTPPSAPRLLRSVPLRPSARPSPVSTLAFPPSGAHLAIGFGDGTALLFRHIWQSLTAEGSGLPKPKVLVEGNGDAVTGLMFREPRPESKTAAGAGGAASSAASSSAGKSSTSETYLFISTLARVLVHPLSKSKRAGGFPTSLGGSPDVKVLDEAVGAGLGCTAGVVLPSTDREVGFAVAREEGGIVVYTPVGRGPSFALPATYSALSSLHPVPSLAGPLPYSASVIILSPPFAPSVAAASGTVRQLAKQGEKDMGRMTVLDLEMGWIAWRNSFRGGGVWGLWRNSGAGALAVGSKDGKVTVLHPARIDDVLQTLYDKALFTLALQLAKSRGIGREGIADVHRRYADWLYEKGDWEGSVGQYVKTIGGGVQGSYVIRRFLDAQKIKHLTTYLQDLHTSGLANSDHTTLLLNCYTKTSDLPRLEAFIRSTSSSSSSEPSFDLDTAIKVCRQAGFYGQAVWMARRWGREEEVVKVLVEDLADWEGVRGILRGMERDKAHENLLRYGKRMLKHEPEATTTLLIDHCCVRLPSIELVSQSNRASVNGAATNAGSGATALSPTHASSPAYLSVFNSSLQLGRSAVEAAAAATAAVLPGGLSPNPAESSSNGAVPPTPKDKRKQTASAQSMVAVESASNVDGESLSSQPAASPPPSPTPFFAHFVSHPHEFLRFLEAIALTRWGQKIDLSRSPAKAKSVALPPPVYEESAASSPPADSDLADQRAMWNTILELHLTFAQDSRTPARDRDIHKQKALRLIEQAGAIPYDATHALILCSINAFTDGLVVLWEALGMYEDVLRFWMDKEKEIAPPATHAKGVSSSAAAGATRRPSDEVMDQLRRHGPSHPYLYPLVLRFLTSSNALLTRHQDDLRSVLDVIDRDRIMPPLQVVQVLSRNDVASIGIVKDWLMQKVGGLRVEIESDRTLIQSYQTETAARQQEIDALTDTSQPTVIQVNRDASTGAPLELPAIHFMCKHSFNQSSLPDVPQPSCPLCAQQHSLIRQIRSSHAQSRGEHDMFQAEIREADDGFSVIASLFSRGLMGTDEADDESDEEESYITLG